MKPFFKRLIIVFLFLLFSFMLVTAQSTYNFLTKGLADTLYCPIDGSCVNGSGGGGSGNVSDVWVNVTGDTMTGNLSITSNASLTGVGTGGSVFFENGSVVFKLGGSG